MKHEKPVRFQVLAIVSMMMIAFWDIALCSLIDVDRHFIVLLMEAVITSEMSVYFNETTRRYIPELTEIGKWKIYQLRIHWL
jgi:hypothetical protein